MRPREARPFLKWAGGKTQLLSELRRFYPAEFNGYLEPFVGSGAVFLDLYNQGRLSHRRVRLMDGNADLIGCYRAVRDSAEEVIRHLEGLAAGHRRDGTPHYYAVRDARFNPRRRRLVTSGATPDVRYPAALAAMLIYLNRTGYNGLFRLNAKGGFNVPAGRYANPRICDADNLRLVARALAAPRTRIDWRRFDTVTRLARPGDFIYFDPPYAPLSQTARFTGYTAGGFTAADQERLQRVAVTLARRGCRVLQSNSSAPSILELYGDSAAAREAGLRIHTIHARRAINSRASSRGHVEELLITNIEA